MSVRRATTFLLGQCLPSIKDNASKISITKMELDQNIHMYFKKVETVFAHDPDKICKSGDIVLIEQLPNKLTKLITHKVVKVIYPLGDIIDPITQKKVVSFDFRDDIEEASELYGKNEEAFDYKSAPPRGWQEGKKDFSNKETYYKYHDDGTDQPQAL